MSTEKALEHALHAELSRLVASMKSLSTELETIVDDIEAACMNSDQPEAVALKKLANGVLARFRK